ncbi:MAG: hypothetical protein IPM56_08145 [Ignavibacteriales bacterium]|nr:MAG: hypothetical protein IPM56_08145 [Ignavibacteriales bacterium]
MKTGDMIKYAFPNPTIAGKEFIIGKIISISLEKVSVLCLDKSKMDISFKNFHQIESIESDEIGNV